MGGAIAASMQNPMWNCTYKKQENKILKNNSWHKIDSIFITSVSKTNQVEHEKPSKLQCTVGPANPNNLLCGNQKRKGTTGGILKR